MAKGDRHKTKENGPRALAKDEARASSHHKCSEPSAASRVFDERRGKTGRAALDPAPGSQGEGNAYLCLKL
jgi:hypothetical protein